MADKKQSRSITPEDFPVTSSSVGLPSGDYSYTLEICMNLRESMGKVVEAVDTLKKQSEKLSSKIDAQNEKIQDVAKDVHAAKFLGIVLAAVMTLIGVLIKILFDYFSR